MRALGMLLVGLAFILSSNAFASDDDETFANSALSYLHEAARAAARHEQAAKDSDSIGCREALDDLQKSAHEALMNMHHMSFVPIDALDSVAALLRVADLSNGSCPTGSFEVMVAGQAIVGLRTDYTIGTADWFTANPDGTIKATNPLTFAQSMTDSNYSWVSVKAKKQMIVVADWNTELGSNNVTDSTLANDGAEIKAIEVDYRKNSGDENTYVYFYRTQQDALAEIQVAKQKSEDDAKEQMAGDVSRAKWRDKLLALSYVIGNTDSGYKLSFINCTDVGQNSDGQNICEDQGSYDWSDNPKYPYHWFDKFTDCNNADSELGAKPPSGKIPAQNFTHTCLPSARPSKKVAKGYKIILSLTAPGTFTDDTIYSEFRSPGHNAPIIFSTFKECSTAADAAYKTALQDLGADADGKLKSDETQTIDLMATCSRQY